MRRVVSGLSVVALAVGVWLIVHSHGASTSCVGSTTSTPLSASPACQHAMWSVMGGVVLVVLAGLALTFTTLLGRHRRDREELSSAEEELAPLHRRVASSHHPGERRAS